MEGIPDDVERIISFVSRDIARKNPPVEREDIQQEMRLYWLSTEKAQRINGSLLQTHLYAVALEWAQKERAEWHGMSVHYYYTPDDVRATMKVLFTYPRQDWEHAYCPDDAKTAGRWTDGLEVMFDAVQGFEAIDEDSQQIIAYANALDRVENLNDVEKKRHQRAVHKLTKTMNTLKNQRGEDLRFSSRRSLTNAAARAAIGDMN